MYDSLTPLDAGDLAPYDYTRQGVSYVSWPPKDVNADPDLTRYWFDDSAGNGVNVYVVDTGANLDHSEFSYSNQRTRWLLPSAAWSRT